MEKSLYRPEIDGLRALAVGAVVLFHLDMGLPGGFVGVDVFFVISGFLITGIIQRGVEAGTFSSADFWERRVRRIFPSLFVMLVATLAVGYWLLLPNELERLGRSSAAQLLLLANVFFTLDTGYFAAPAEFEPLLHTWSLAVEEQFYLFFPLVLCGLKRLNHVRRFQVLAIAATISFVASVYGTRYYPSGTFYLLPTRAWELLVGCLLAVSPWRTEISTRHGRAIAVVGVVAIVLPVFLYSSQTRFPGLAAAPPVLGTAAVILGTKNSRDTWVYKALAFRPVVFVGLISYSLYLWHWPVIVFTRIYWGTFGWPQILFALTVSVVLAVLSWRFIETPLRRQSLIRNRQHVFASALGLTAVLSIASLTLFATRGLPHRLAGIDAEILEDTTWCGDEYRTHTHYTGSLQVSDLAPLGQPPADDSEIDFVVWGDSHAIALSKCLDETARDVGLTGAGIFVHGMIPLPKIVSLNRNVPGRLELKNEIMNFLERQRVRNLVIIARWSLYEGSADRYWPLSESPELLPSAERQSEIINRQLQALVQFCSEREIALWVFKEVPRIDTAPARQWLRYQWRGIRPATGSRTLADHRVQQRRVETLFTSLPVDRVRVLDPSRCLCDREERVIYYGAGRALYKDDNHLTRWGAELVKPVVLEMFLEMSGHVPAKANALTAQSSTSLE